jgi:hypothetical protein
MVSRGNLVILKLFFHYYHIRCGEILYLTKYIYIYISQWHNQNVIRSQNIKTSLKGFFCLIIKVFFFVIIKSAYVWLCHFIHKENNKKKGWGACDTLEGAWLASTHFRQRVWSLSTSKKYPFILWVEASSCPLPTGVALSAAVVRFFTSESFFFLSLLPWKS